ncbi:tetratricopeptide repeat protein [Azospirillum rugosum]|uniref:Tetratricopeptide (TPR) repeat protein n=1 Tax=Azospirillum rugosum TaxID=416170 RepID=A0ABS4SIU9_9PROT|nr:tetratricopeptide repeat protein [Azospirillum rugosum]MBP2292144.1 tetratricopeptide (TPR) repeat protein [Azospirillum rugosum]MDQ0525720.1 tetratricopeptide (TPR) repeat protein [Azospirillum rugosum]
MSKINVFISSTQRDLSEYRKAVIDAIHTSYRFQPSNMENFGAQDGAPKEVCRRKLEQCDIYVGIFGACYGSISVEDNLSFTELEYRWAKAGRKKILTFVIGEDFQPSMKFISNQEDFIRAATFREAIKRECTFDSFLLPDDLATKVINALHNAAGQIETDESSAARKQDASPTAPPNKQPLHQLPSDLPDFTGRATEVDQLIAALDREHGGSAAVSAIRGMGGIGKTTLAVHAARRLLRRYPDAQIVVNLQGHGDAAPLTSLEAMAQVIRAFHPDMKPVDDPQQMASVYRSVLEGKRALILLDNAADTAQVEPLVPPPPCGLIVTAREPIHLDGAAPLKLGLLPRPESVALLRAAARPKTATDAEWDRIADLCDDLPLALRVAGSFLAHAEDCTAADYIADLADEQTRLDVLKVERKERGNVGTVLAHSARRLAETDPELAAFWQVLTIFPADFDRAAAAAVWGLAGEKDAAAPLRKVLDRGLLLFEDGSKRYRLHDLMRPLARGVFAWAPDRDPSPGSAQRLLDGQSAFAQYFMTVLGHANVLFRTGHQGVADGLALCDREWLNISATAEWAQAHREENDQARGVSAELPNAGVNVLSLRLTARQRIFWLEAARASARSLGERGLEGSHLGNLGVAYVALGETRRAIEHHKQALAIAREIGDRRGEGTRLGNLGVAYATLGETRRAIEHHKQALAIVREIGDRRGEGSVLGNLGLAYADLDEVRRAIEHYEQALAIAREIGDRRGESNNLGNLGCAYARLGETRRAIEHHEQALAIAREIGDRRGEGSDLGNLGLAYAALGETRRAIEQYEQALAIAREIGDRHGEGVSLGNLGLAYADLGETRRAVECLEQALAIFEAIESPYADWARQRLAELRGATAGA